MRWHRIKETGGYVAGPYAVEKGPVTGPAWRAHGPGVDRPAHRLKDAAQAACLVACHDRLRDGGGKTCTAVEGDAVVIDDGRRGEVTAVLRQEPSSEYAAQTTYAIRLPRGKRLCLFRGEFEVVVP